jgi:D-alanyl-D-alanine carboxypeptidase/D-alanyl-D-alanine-endopeptidase (penicillin-binding protein 4)
LTVLDAQTGEQVFAANPDMGLAPGSTMKAVTSVTALNVLGSDYLFHTDFGYRGAIANGTLTGDVIIKGYGDPTLGSWRWENTKQTYILNQMVAALRKAGIRKKVQAGLLAMIRTTPASPYPNGWIWQDLGTYYGAGTSALCWGENQFGLKLRTGAVGSLVCGHRQPACYALP